MVSARLEAGSVLCLCLLGLGAAQAYTDRPVVAIMAQQTFTISNSSSISPAVRKALEAYRYVIPASYVNWVGQAGARALPVLLGEAPEYYDKIFQVSNGLLFPGGNQGISPGAVYTDEGAQLYTLALAANDAGDDYPIWGTCLGFEELAVLAAPPDANVVSEDVKATNVALPLDYAAGANESRLLASFPPDLVSALAKENVTFNSHDHGVLLSTFEATPDLASFFAVISTNHLAKSGAEFVSTMEAFDYPFYGTQWHPEKANFEWSLGPDYSNIPHSPTAVEASQATANFFVEAARGSSHVFPEAARDALVYAAPVLYTGEGDWWYEQVYLFCPVEEEDCGASLLLA